MSVPSIELCSFDECKTRFAAQMPSAVEIHSLERMMYQVSVSLPDIKVWIRHPEGGVQRFNALNEIQDHLNEHADYFAGTPVYLMYQNTFDEMIGVESSPGSTRTNMGWQIGKYDA